jgi:hypothetical protein
MRALRIEDKVPRKPDGHTDGILAHSPYTVEKRWKHDTAPDVMVNSTEGKELQFFIQGEGLSSQLRQNILRFKIAIGRLA